MHEGGAGAWGNNVYIGEGEWGQNWGGEEEGKKLNQIEPGSTCSMYACLDCADHRHVEEQWDESGPQAPLQGDI